MANIRVDTTYTIQDGSTVVFSAPCNCNEADGLKVYYPGGSKEFEFTDSHGNILTGIGALFAKGALVKALLDVTNGFAYIQNADTNAYLEERLKTDTSLKSSGKPADAKAVGDRLKTLETITPEAIMKNLGITASADELNYIAGAKANVQAQLDKLVSDHAILAARWFKPVNNTDMNTVKTTGFYYGHTGMVNAAVTDNASTIWEVIAYSSDWGVQRQTVINSNGTTETYERSWYAGSSWSAWRDFGGASTSGGGMNREFSKTNATDTLTTPGALSKIYVVTVRIGSVDYSITVDWKGVQAAGSAGRTFGIAAKNSGGSVTIFEMTAVVNANSTVTFEAPGCTIVHVCGYY